MIVEQLSASARRVTLTVSLTLFMALMDEAILVTAMPSIADNFEVSPLALGLAISIYMTAAVAVLPISGWIAERYGVRRVFVCANLSFGCASLCCALAAHYWPFIAARAFQGAAAGMMVMVGRLILLRAIPREQYIAALNFTTIPMLIGPTIGPAIGGLIVTYGQWPLIFLLNLPVVVIVCVGAIVLVPPIRSARETPLDWPGAFVSSLSLALLLAGLNGLGKPGSMNIGALLFTCGLVTGGVAVRHFRMHRAPLISLEPLSHAGFRAATVSGGMFLRIPLRAQSFIVPLVLQIALGLDPLRTGLLMLALTGGDLLLKPLVLTVYRKVGQLNALRYSGLFGICAVAATLGFREGVADWMIALVLAACGMTRSILFTGLSTMGLAGLKETELGAANVLMNISLQLTGALAISITAVIIQVASGDGPATLNGFSLAVLALVAIGVIGLIRIWRLEPDR